MNSGIYYLYEYKKDQQLRNTGFIRITACFQTYCLQIHAQTLSFTPDNPVHLSALFQEEETTYLLDLLELPIHDSSICTHLKISDFDLPAKKHFSELTGFLLSDGQYYYAILEEGYSLNVDQLKHFQEIQPLPEPPSKDTPPARNIQKIQRKDLCCLPRQYWSLANNSFLMHGCRNYKHLLLVEENGHLQLGIPGLYSCEEAKAAQLFGFPIFVQSYLTEVQLSEYERDPDESFGYWCRYL